MLWDQLNALQTTQEKKKKKKSRSINATKPMAPGALQHCGASCQKKSTVLWCSEASVLLIYSFTSGSYYWRRQIKGLEGFWQVDKCCLTRQSTGQTVRCSLTTLTLHPPATKGFELISHAHSHTQRAVDLSTCTRPSSVWTAVSGRLDQGLCFFLPKPWKRAMLRPPQVKLLWLMCACKILLNKILTEHWRVSSRSKRKAYNDIKKDRHSVREAHIYLFVLLERMSG